MTLPTGHRMAMKTKPAETRMATMTAGSTARQLWPVGIPGDLVATGKRRVPYGLTVGDGHVNSSEADGSSASPR